MRPNELDQYEGLLGAYRHAFGEDAVCHAPIPDFEFVDCVVSQEIIYVNINT